MKSTRRPLVRLVVLVALALAVLLAPAVALAAAPGTPAPTAAPKGPPPGPTATTRPPTGGPTPTSRAGGAAPATPAPAPAGSHPAYDPTRDKGCGDCGPNGHPESAGDRVARWADDCRKAGGSNCEADSVQRLYSEYRSQGRDWADSGYAAPPDMASSPHNCPDYWAGDAKGCVADGSAAGTGGGGGDGGGTGGYFGFDPVSFVRSALGAIDWKTLLTGLLKGLYEIVVGDGIAQLGDQLAGFVLATPNLLAEDGGMGNVQRLVDDLRYAAMFACIIVFTATVISFMAGREQEPQAALGRLGAVLFVLGFYRTLVGWLLRGANELASGIQHVGADTTTGVFTTTLKLLLPTAAPLWYLLALLGALLVIAIGVVKIVGLAFLLLTYVAGPLLLPLGIHPRTAGWVGVWLEHLVKALGWPLLWAIEFRVFGALAGGLSFFDAQGQFSLGTGALGALLALASLLIMAGTPWALHTQFTLRRGAQVLVQQVGRAADVAVLAATGGASMTARGAIAGALTARRPARSADGE
jgi:hypothetical protein